MIAMPKVAAVPGAAVGTTVNDDDDDGLVIVTTLLNLPMPLRVYIFNYLGETQDELIDLTLISKQVHEDCYRPGIEWKIIPTIVISPTPEGGVGSTRALLQRLNNQSPKSKLRRYTHMKINDIHRFNDNISTTEIHEIIGDAEMDWIVSLDMSLSMPNLWVTDYFPNVLIYILPNLREIDISYNIPDNHSIMDVFFECSKFEKVTWNNIKIKSYIAMDGTIMESSDNLKEVIMDDSEFSCRIPEGDTMSDLGNHRDTFIFNCCSTALERVSIRNAKWITKNHYHRRNDPIVVPQNALIKFVRNAPASLRWFRSDLTIENMNMLRLERPTIELLN